MTDLPTETAINEAPVCIHRWMLETPVGGVTRGICRECGQAREFTETTSRGAYLSRHRPR
jgi:hypothetical protein